MTQLQENGRSRCSMDCRQKWPGAITSYFPNSLKSQGTRGKKTETVTAKSNKGLFPKHKAIQALRGESLLTTVLASALF